MIYSYKCTKCDHEFDREHSVLDVDDTKCEKCGEDSSRIISVPPAFILKGSGWAKDGYK